MLKKLWLGLVGLVILGVPAMVFAQDAVDPNNLGQLITTLIEAAKGGDWSLVVSLALMLLVFLATKVPFISNWLPSKAKPWVVAVAGVVLAVVTTAVTSGDWLSAVLNGLVTGAAASGLWELVGKRLLERSPE